MKKPKRHLILASILIIISLAAYFLKIIDWKLEILLLLLLFPYLSFSLIFLNNRMPKEKEAIDVMRRRYST